MILAPIPLPDLAYADRTLEAAIARPSWSANPGYLNDGHRTVYAETKDIPGWQMEPDAYKLYEMAYFVGDVILDLGVYGGRSSVVELKGALSNPSRQQRPQVFALDIERPAIHRSHEVLKGFGLSESVLLFLGGVESFFQTFEVGPTMVFVDADHRYEGVERDLKVLSRVLAPGVPVLCHDYLNVENDTGEYGVRRAATEWEQAGFVEFRGAFGCSAFFVTTNKCQGGTRRLRDEEFALRRDACLISYGLRPTAEVPEGDGRWHQRVLSLEHELASIRASPTYRLAGTIARLARPFRRLVRRLTASPSAGTRS